MIRIRFAFRPDDSQAACWQTDCLKDRIFWRMKDRWLKDRISSKEIHEIFYLQRSRSLDRSGALHFSFSLFS